MTFSFHPEAEEELVAAIDYYEAREAGRGCDFSIEILTAMRNLVAYPTAWPVVEDGVRRCLLNGFPFCVLQSLEPGGVDVLAVMHLRRWPDYWRSR